MSGNRVNNGRFLLHKRHGLCKLDCSLCDSIAENINNNPTLTLLPDIITQSITLKHYTQANHFMECITIRENSYYLPDNFDKMTFIDKLDCVTKLFKGIAIDDNEKTFQRKQDAVQS